MIVPVIILVVLICFGVWSIYTAVTNNNVEYGYKYYPPKYISNRKTEPGSFWMVVIIYSLAVIGATWLLIGTLLS